MTAKATGAGRATVIYDADCGFCRWSLALLLTLDRSRAECVAPGVLRVLPLGTVEADRLLADLTEEQRNASWHLVVDADVLPSPPGVPPQTPVRTRFSAGAALAPVLALLRGGRLPASLLARAPRLTERAYRRVAEHRGALGRFVPARARRWADRVIAAHRGPECPQ